MAEPEGSRAIVRTGILCALALVGGLAVSGIARAAMETGSLTSQPIGHYEFCKKNASECMIRPQDAGPVRMNGKLWRQIVSVNAAVNRAVRPMNDFDVHGKDEVWSYPVDDVGDCEDYALEKRRMLSRQGISLSNLLITVVRKPDGEGHAVLTVRSDKGDFILDNLSETVKPWEKTGYRFLKRQASNHTGRWVTIRADQNVLVGSVKQ